MISEAIHAYRQKHGLGAQRLKAVLFDMDGVIYNSMPRHAYSWHHAMAQFGLHMDEADAYRYEGMRGVETIKKLCREQWGREVSEEEAQAMYAEKSRVFAAAPPTEKMEGITDLMRQICDDGVRIGVVTGSGQHSLLDHLEEAFPGLLHKQWMVTSFDVSHGKPCPDPYLMGLQKTGASASEAIVVENAPLGVEAAVRAGIFTVAVNTGPLPDTLLREKGADLVFSKMTTLARQWCTLRQAFEEGEG